MDFLIHHMLRSSANRLPGKEALVHGRDRLTYSEVEARVNSLAAGLRDAGIHRGDRVAIWVEPSVPQALSIFAVSRAGCVFVPVNHVLFPEQVVHIMKDCGVSAIITTGAKLAALSQLNAEIPSLKLAVLTDLQEG